MYTKIFEYLNKDKSLLIVDVQKRFVNKRYVNKLFEYCKTFKEVYQVYYDDSYGIYDDEIRSYDVDYEFPNQKDIFVKGLNFYEYAIDKLIWDEETDDRLSIDDYDVGHILELPENNNIGNYSMIKIKDQQWLLIDDDMERLIDILKDKEVILVGGFKDECLFDVYIFIKSLGINVKINDDYVF